jgi:hypothetical protein
VTDTVLTFRIHLNDNYYSDIPVTVGALGTGDTFTIWLVNQTNQAVWVDRPASMKGKVAGEASERNISLTQGGGNTMDQLPDMIFAPTKNKWPQ